MDNPRARGVQFVLATYWITAADALRGLKFMKTAGITHACEYETSMMLTLHRDLVDMKKARSKITFVKSNFISLDYAKTNVTMVRTFKEATATGSMGRPEFATAEKGRKLLDLIENKCCEFVREFERW
jgi:creatinine amidohydrolase